MYRYDSSMNHFVQDRIPGVREELIDMGRDGLAMYYCPEETKPGGAAGVVIMHCDQNYMPMAMGPMLAARGCRVVACEAKEGGILEDKFSVIDRAARFLRSHGAEHIVLMGHSGGATLMTAYQAVAENGADIFRGPRMIWQCRADGEYLPADGIMLIDANYGNGVMALLSLDPAIEEEGRGTQLDPQWDIFSEANGYDPAGAHYSAEFIRRYRAAQVRRSNALIAAAQDRLAAIEAGTGNYLDDEPFPIAGASQIKPNNRMLPQDLRQLSHTKGEYDLIHGDGTVTHEVIRCLRNAEVDRCFTMYYGMGANKNTVRGFLSAQAIRADEASFNVGESSVDGVDWDSSFASPIGNIRHIHVPLLAIGMTGSYEYLASEMICERAPMEDKTIAFVRGADHNLNPNRSAERYPGEFGDTAGACCDFMAAWMKRFRQ